MPVHLDKSRHRSDFSGRDVYLIGEDDRAVAIIIWNAVKGAGCLSRRIESCRLAKGDC